MDGLTIKHNELTADEFLELGKSVNWHFRVSLEQAKVAMANSVLRISVFDGEKIVGMARMIGDKALCYYIKDVAVRPEYQRKGIGKMMVGELLDFIKANGFHDTEIFVELCAMPDKIPFYEKFGFSANEAQRLKIMMKVD